MEILFVIVPAFVGWVLFIRYLNGGDFRSADNPNSDHARAMRRGHDLMDDAARDNGHYPDW